MQGSQKSNESDFRVISYVELLFSATRNILVDEGFRLPTPQASSALEPASSLLEWSEGVENKEQVSLFIKALVWHLQNCFTAGLDKTEVVSYLSDIQGPLDNFLKVSIKKGGPIFFQFLTSQMFKALIKLRFPATIPVSSRQDTDESLSCDEKDYAAGYIPRNLLLKIKHRNKESLKIYLLDIFNGLLPVVAASE